MGLFNSFMQQQQYLPPWARMIGGGQQAPYGTPPIYGGPSVDQQAPLWGQMGPDQQPAPQVKTQRPSFFDTGQLRGRDWLGLALGAVGDAFAQQGGGQAMIGPMVMQGIIGARQAKREQEQRIAEAAAKQADEAAKRQAANEDWLAHHNIEDQSWQAHQDYTAAHPQPTAQMQNYDTYSHLPDPKAQQDFLQFGDANKPQIVQGEDGFYAVDPVTHTATRVNIGGASPSGAPIAKGQYGSTIEQSVSSLIPGVNVTSRARSPEQNAAAGGVPNSFHLTDNARDFTPPQGTSMGQLYDQVKAQLGPKGYDVINEGDHVHVEPGPTLAGNAPATSGAPLKPRARVGEGGAGEAQLTQDGLDAAASRYMATGQMPALGRGSPETRAKIINRAGELARLQGQDPMRLPAFQAEFSANKNALSQLEAQAAKILSFEETARRNGQQVLQLAGKGTAKTGVPIFNAWVQAGRRHVEGDPNVSGFDLQVQAFANEYARVTNSATGGGISTDSARQEIMSKINAAQTPQQLAEVMRVAFIDMDNRKAGYKSQIDQLRQNLGGAPAAPQPSGGVARVNNDADYAKLKSGAEFIGPDGKRRRKP